MKIDKIAENVRIVPTDRKMKQARQAGEKLGVLSKEMPLERNVHIVSFAETMERIKDNIQLTIEKIKG